MKELFPAFDEKINAILEELKVYTEKHMPGYEWHVYSSVRTAQEQYSLFKQGRFGNPGVKVTALDGYKKKSSHQYGLAVDIVPFVNGGFTWVLHQDHWRYLGHLYRKYGLKWGGDWGDMPHGEWPRENKAIYREAWKWINGR